jgi:uncharacterized protein (DUF1501 family)
MGSDFSRRDLFKKGGVLAVGMMTPPWLASVAKADLLKAASGKSADSDTVLIVCQFSGGNDGLNTFVPHKDPEYYKNRKTVGIPASEVLDMNDGLGMHPNMTGLHELYKGGKVAVIQNVGYPNPNRSHFKSMDIWQSASPDEAYNNGWIGRHFEREMAAGDFTAISGIGLSTEKPRALMSDDASIPCFASLADIQQMVGDADSEKLLRQIQGREAKSGTATRTIQQASNTALDAMSALKTKLSTYKAVGKYPERDRFGTGFKQIAQLVATSPQTRVIYFSTGGFDTHARQATNHGNLMKGFSDSVKVFMDEMEAIGKADKVVILVFSEFGRRVAENGSAGTDHGKAGPMILIGNKVKGGVYGPNPDLQDLHQGDLRWKTDFRQVYATALDDWLGSDSEVVLGGEFEKMGLIK